MMYTLELSRPCTCKDERGKNDLWPSAYGLYLYNYICTLFEIFFFYFVCTVHGQDASYIYWEIYIYASFTIHPHGLWLRWNLIQIIPIRSVPRVDSSPQPPTGALKLLNESTSSSVNDDNFIIVIWRMFLFFLLKIILYVYNGLYIICYPDSSIKLPKMFPFRPLWFK